jgi:hypothetical protein
MGSPFTRCCIEQFIRGEISDNMQRDALNLPTHQDSGRYSISLQIITIP